MSAENMANDHSFDTLQVCNMVNIFNSLTRNRKFPTIVKETISESFTSFCEQSTLHGLKYIGSKKLHWIERLFFAISVIFVGWASVYFVKSIYDYWRTSPLIIGADSKPNYITDDPFPAITICNLNQADKSKVKAFSIFSQQYARLQLLCKRTVNGNLAATVTDWSNFKDFIEEISQDCSNMVIDCKFGSKAMNCSEIFKPIITDEGLCCSFNMLHPKFIYKVSSNYRASFGNDSYAVNWNPEMGYPKELPEQYFPRPTPGVGQSLGLSLILNVEADQYYCSSMNSIGFKMLLHNPLEIPSLRDIGLLLAPGNEALVRIKPHRTTSLPELKKLDTSFRNCYFQGELHLRNFKYYSISTCHMNCLAYMLLENCNCIPYFLPPLHTNDTICSILSSSCVDNTLLRAIRPIGNQTSCMLDCLPACYDLSYDAELFDTPLANSGFKITNNVVGNISNDFVDKNIAVVHLFFSELTYRADKQKLLFGTTEFLASVGGIMGLFFGFSLISFAEIIYFILFVPIRKIMKILKDEKIKTMKTKNKSFRAPPILHFSGRFTPTKNKIKLVVKNKKAILW